MAAVAALHALGDEGAFQVLRQGVSLEASTVVQLMVLATLKDHYTSHRVIVSPPVVAEHQ